MPTPDYIDLDFRPGTYWDPGDVAVANILGDVRKANVLDAVREGWTDRLPSWYFAERLPSEEFQLLRRKHSGFPGGERLPPYLEDEVEIARVTFDPAVRTVVAIRARRGLAVAIEHVKLSSVHYPGVSDYYCEFGLPWAELRLARVRALSASVLGAMLGDQAPREPGYGNGYPLHLAAANGGVERVRELLDAGLDVNARAPGVDSERKQAPIPRFGSNAGLAEKLFKRAGFIPDEVSAGATPLHLAAAYGHIEVARLLLAAGASPSLGNAAGLSPGEQAGWAGHADLAAVLDAACRKRR